MGNARREVESFKESYDALVADEKMLERTFRKEFPECDPHTVDVLYKLFKKRPRPQRSLKAASDQVGCTVFLKGEKLVNEPCSTSIALLL